MSVIFPAPNFQWLLVCVCALILGIVTPNKSESAERITRPLNTSGVLMQHRIQAKVADYALNLDDESYYQDQALEVRAPKNKQKSKNSAMAEIQMATYGIAGGNMKKPRQPSKHAVSVQEDKEVDALAEQLGKTNFSERTPSQGRLNWRRLASLSRRAARSQTVRRALRRLRRRPSDAHSDTDTNMSGSARHQGYESA
ncbi:unnamed protein product [Bemisia tabaci]|uniref:Uncharacterized protein n=1 Tax=Bemisia tabaci TaxID=7038 RepID=A0A9P0A4M0_BEMTA|nr:unnamed protein product [Bemisia tabaci]